ncbi:MAG: serine/threonine protein kinase [Planctomycetaceae bacterium]|nr:serine/threonine protein kinase [Planctomycetaceae bacterium]
MTEPKNVATTAFVLKDNPEEMTEALPSGVLMPGLLLNGKYELLEQIGRGGMGVVWKANERVADRLVALKFVPHDLRRYEAEMERVREVFRKVHALNHQWICPTYSLEDGGALGYYLVMKYLDGETLDRYVARKDSKRKGLPLNQVITILSRAASALDYAHRHKVIHRDIKPSNIFLIKVGGKLHIQLIDFGLVEEIKSTLTRISHVQFDIVGTRPYMATEQWLGKQQTAKTDQYQLAVVAYELLAGHLPFQGTDLQVMSNAVLNLSPEPIPNIPDDVNAVLLRAMSKEPAERYGTCQEFIGALNGAWTMVANDASSPRPKRKVVSSLPIWGWGAIASCLILAVVGAVVIGTSIWTTPAPPIQNESASADQSRLEVEAVPEMETLSSPPPKPLEPLVPVVVDLIELRGHADAIDRLSFSPDGTKIVTTSFDSTARIWDAESGTLLQTLEHSDRVYSANFSPDGTRIVTSGRDPTIRIWDAESGEELQSLSQHQDTGGFTIFSPDGERIVTVGGDRIIRIWGVESETIVRTLDGHDGTCYAVFSPDGQRIVSSGGDWTARIWDIESGAMLRELGGHAHAWILRGCVAI